MTGIGTETLGVRILVAHDDEEDGDYKIVWEYIGPDWFEQYTAKKEEFEKEDILVQILKSISCTHDTDVNAERMWVRMD